MKTTIPLLYRVLIYVWRDVDNGSSTQRVGQIIADGLQSLPVQASFLTHEFRIRVIPLGEVQDRYLLEGD